jgi:long-chain fatty acid transport protein
LHAEIKDGSADFSTPPPALSSALQAAFPDGRIRTEIDLPPSVRTGLLARPAANWNVEFDAVWTGWSSVDELVVDFKEGLPVPRDPTPFSWQDSMAYSVGTEYRWSPWILRAGYTYDLAPIPDDTLNPILADGDRQWFSTGVGYRRGNWRFDLAYQYILFSRSKQNELGAAGSSAGTPPAIPSIDARANGTYSSRVSVLGLGASLQF